MLSNSVEGFQAGDLVWLVEQVLWPVLIKNRIPKKSVSTGRDYLDDHSNPNPQHPIHSKINQRIVDFCQSRYEYEVLKLPIPTLDSTGKVILVQDYELLPFYYSTKPVPTQDTKYNRALIQAIQISSSWAVPSFKTVRDEIKEQVDTPPIHNPIHIGCPSVSGVYYKGTISQNMMEPRLIERIRNETTIIDLTKELLNQGISHWKHTSKSVQFHPPVVKKKLKQVPFPTMQVFEECRIGSQVIRKGDYVVTSEDKVLKVTRIGLSKGSICLYCDKVELLLQQIKHRFDPCYEMTRFSILDQSDWQGNTIVPQLYPNMK